MISFYWSNEGRPINYDPLKRPRRQDWDGVYKENGAIYIFSRTHFERYQCRAAEKCNLYKMSSKSSIEIDDLDDLEIVSNLMSFGLDGET